MTSNVDLSTASYDMQQTSQAQERVGQRICQRMDTLLAGAFAVKKMAEVASGHGNRVLCTGVTLATGLGCIAHGNLIGGGIATFAALKEAVNIYKAVNPDNDISSLLNDANAGVDMIKTLEEANSESFKTVDINLKIIGKNVEKMNDRMRKIKAISTEGQKDIQDLKRQAAELYDEAQDQFSTAKDSFKLSQARFKQANEVFKRALKQFDELFELAQKADVTDQVKVDKFITIAQKLQKQCHVAQEVMKKGNQYMEDGLEALDVAQEKEREAYAQSMVAMERAKNKLDLIAAQAKVKKEYEKKVGDTQKELEDIQERNQEIKSLLGELSDDLKDAKQLSDDKFGTTSVLFGVVPGAVTGFALGGWGGAMAGGYAGGSAVHNRDTIMGKVDDLINGKVEYLDVNPENREELVKIKFRSRSSGWINRFIRKISQSYTVGMVDIRAGNEMISLPFNLNKDYRIKKSDLYDLQQLLGKKVVSGEMTAKQCLNVINELENKYIDRGIRHRAQVGIVASNCSYFAELKRHCNKIATQEQKSAEDLAREVAGRATAVGG